MCSRKDLTEAILRNPDISFDEYGEEQNKMLGLLSYLFDCGKKIYVEKKASSFDNKEELGRLYYNKEDFSAVLIKAYTSAKYALLKEVSLVKFSELIDMFNREYKSGRCGGIIFNPNSEAEFIIEPKTISKFLHYKEDSKENCELTRAILKNNSLPQDERNEHEIIRVIFSMYQNNEKVNVASSVSSKGEIIFNTILIQNPHYRGNYLMVFSEKKYFSYKNNDEITQLSVKNLIDILAENLSEDGCSGIVINPNGKEARMILSREFFYKLFAVLEL